MPHPVVSVVVPAFRQAAFVGATLDSVAAQTYRGRVEVIVVDDGCPEGTGEVAAAHALGPRVLRQDNRGVAAARNTGIAAARGRYVAFLDADDRWLPEKLELQLERLERRGEPALSFTRYRTVDTDGKALANGVHPGDFGEPGARTLFRGNYVGCSTAVVDKRCLEVVGGFPLSPGLARGGQDYALWLRLALRYPLLYEPRVLVDYLVHDRSRVGKDTVKNFEGALHAIGAVWDKDGALCRRALGRSYAGYVARQLRMVAGRLVRERAFEREKWRSVRQAAWIALARGPRAERATWPEPLTAAAEGRA